MASSDTDPADIGRESGESYSQEETHVPESQSHHHDGTIEESDTGNTKSESEHCQTETESAVSESLKSVKDLERNFRYLKFQEYDFTKDSQFQVGWNKLSSVVPTEQFDKQFLKAKLFYYSKHIEPMDINDYLTWKETNASNEGEPAPLSKDESASNVCDKGDNSCNPGGPVPADSDSNISEPLSFSDVVEIIQSGKTIPGIKTLDIIPTENDPSPSVLERKSKPWES